MCNSFEGVSDSELSNHRKARMGLLRCFMRPATPKGSVLIRMFPNHLFASAMPTLTQHLSSHEQTLQFKNVFFGLYTAFPFRTHGVNDDQRDISI